jgi:regulator of extracellular matrix RemA (YlzA/DUF370 family)
MQLINIGFGNTVSANRIVAIVSPESAPIKRIVQEAKESGNAIDATCGRRTRAVVIMDSGHVVLSAVQPETVAGRLDKEEKEDLGGM